MNTEDDGLNVELLSTISIHEFRMNMRLATINVDNLVFSQ